MFRNKKIFLHIGYQKSASTTLQKNLFAKHPSFDYLGRNSLNKSHGEFQGVLKKLRILNTLEYDKNHIALRFHQIMKNFQKTSKNILISDEGLTNSRWSDIGLVADRLRSLFPTAKVFLLIRNQTDLIRSFYDMTRADLFCFNSKKVISADRWVERNFQYIDRSFFLSLNYDRILKKYINLFGKNNVEVFLFEEFVHERKIFLKKLSRFLKINVDEAETLLQKKHDNKGKTEFEHKSPEIISCFPKPIKKMSPEVIRTLAQKIIRTGNRKKTVFSRNIKNKLYDYYKDSNIELKKMYPLELDKYHYI